jgi:hypothetical protein
MKRFLTILVLAVCSTRLFAGTVNLADFSITAFNPSSVAYTTQLSALWGTYAGGVFTPLVVSTPTIGVNSGYLLNADNEFQLTLTQGNNNNIVAGSPLSVAIFDGSTYSASLAQIVLEDTSWVAPAFTITTPELSFVLTSSTFVQSIGGQSGIYNYDGGSPTVTLAVPEPSSYALLAMGGLAFGGYVIRRRRRA